MRISRHFAAVAIIVVSTATAMAQPPGRGQGNRMGGDSPNDPAYLLDSESVQKELALTGDQKTRLQQIRDDDEENGATFFRGLMRLTPEQMQTRFQQRASAMRKKIAKVLTPEQMQRLDEINIQAAGVTALSYADVAKELKLTAEQKEELNKLGEESRGKLAGLYSPANGQPVGGLSQQQLSERRNEIRTQRNDESLGLLTEEQKAVFERLQGAKFDTNTIKPRQRSYTNRGRIGPPPGFVPPQRPGRE